MHSVYLVLRSAVQPSHGSPGQDFVIGCVSRVDNTTANMTRFRRVPEQIRSFLNTFCS
jgi:hypothetical protein